MPPALNSLSHQKKTGTSCQNILFLDSRVSLLLHLRMLRKEEKEIGRSQIREAVSTRYQCYETSFHYHWHIKMIIHHWQAN